MLDPIRVYIRDHRASAYSADARTIRDELNVPMVGDEIVFDAHLVAELRAVGYFVEEIFTESANAETVVSVPHTRDGFLFDWSDEQ